MKKVLTLILVLCLVLSSSVAIAEITEKSQNQSQGQKSKPKLLDTVNIFPPFQQSTLDKKLFSELNIWPSFDVSAYIYLFNINFFSPALPQGSRSLNSIFQKGSQNSITLNQR